MNPNNQALETDEIDLGEIIRKLWKEKFLILSISLSIYLSFVDLFYYYFLFIVYILKELPKNFNNVVK